MRMKLALSVVVPGQVMTILLALASDDLPAAFRQGAPSALKGSPLGFSPLLEMAVDRPSKQSEMRPPHGWTEKEYETFLQLRGVAPDFLHRVSNYALAGAFLGSALTYKCRTMDPSEAQLFFVPAFSEKEGFGSRNNAPMSSCATPRCNKTALVALLASVQTSAGVSVLAARHGSDHILLSPREGHHDHTKPYPDVNLLAPQFSLSVRFACEEGAYEGSTYEWPSSRFITRAPFRSTPFASFVQLPATTGWEAAPWRSSHPRPLLVGSASNLHHEGWKIGGSGLLVIEASLPHDFQPHSCS